MFIKKIRPKKGTEKKNYVEIKLKFMQMEWEKIRIFLWSILPQKELGAKNHKTDWITRIVIASGWIYFVTYGFTWNLSARTWIQALALFGSFLDYLFPSPSPRKRKKWF